MKRILPFSLLLGLATLGQTSADTINKTVTTVSAFANSATDFLVSFPAAGVPDANGWNYGYYDHTADGGSGLATDYDHTTDFVQFTAGQTNAGGNSFRLVPNNAPWTNIAANNNGHPNGTNSAPNAEHWAIRRYTVQAGVPAVVDLNWSLASANGSGSGTTLNVYRNGVPIANATTSSTAGESGIVSFTDLTVGDIIDFALTPEGTDSSRVDASDSSNFGGFFGSTNTQTFTFETVGVIADSDAEFSGVQGANGWRYGYYDIGVLGGIPTTASDFTEFATDGSTNLSNGVNHWNGSTFDFDGNPPWTFISADQGHPNGANNTNEQWATRRYEVQPGEEGDLLVEFNLRAQNTNGTGTSVHVMVDGTIVDTISTNDGVEGEEGWIELTDIAAGTIIDFALSPSGPGDGLTGAGDGADGSFFDATIHLLVPEPGTASLLGFAALCLALRRRK